MPKLFSYNEDKYFIAAAQQEFCDRSTEALNLLFFCAFAYPVTPLPAKEVKFSKLDFLALVAVQFLQYCCVNRKFYL